LFQRLRKLARPLRGDSAPDETAHEYAAVLIDRLTAFQTTNRLNKWLLSQAGSHVNSLTDLYAQSLFSPSPLTRADTRSAVQTWSRLRWRLFLMNLLQMAGARSLSH
jgi:hypothetical protein